MTTQVLAQAIARDQLRAALRGGVIAAIDLGDAKTAAVVARFEPDAPRNRLEPRALGIGVSSSNGVQGGEIFDIAAASAAVKEALDLAADAARQRPDFAVVSIGGCAPRSLAASARIGVSGGVIRQKDVARALGAGRARVMARTREPVFAAPVAFMVDGKPCPDPLGVQGRSLSVETHILTVERAGLRALTDATRAAMIEPVAVAVASHASGLACLTDDELDLGAGCVDMGASGTRLAVFRNGRLAFVDMAPIGGAAMTRDLAAAFGLSLADAEALKLSHGAAHLADPSEIAPLPGGRMASRGALVGVLRPRLEETLELVRGRFRQDGAFNASDRPIILTGGASQLPGVVEIAQKTLGRRVRLGRPIHLRGAPDATLDPGFATVAGLLDYAALQDREIWTDVLFESLETKGAIAEMAGWFVRNW